MQFLLLASSHRMRKQTYIIPGVARAQLGVLQATNRFISLRAFRFQKQGEVVDVGRQGDRSHFKVKHTKSWKLAKLGCRQPKLGTGQVWLMMPWHGILAPRLMPS